MTEFETAQFDAIKKRCNDLLTEACCILIDYKHREFVKFNDFAEQHSDHHYYTDDLVLDSTGNLPISIDATIEYQVQTTQCFDEHDDGSRMHYTEIVDTKVEVARLIVHIDDEEQDLPAECLDRIEAKLIERAIDNLE